MGRKVDYVNQTDARVLFEHLHELVHRFRHVQQQALAADESGLSVMEARALGFLANHEGATPGDLAKRAYRDKGQVTRLLHQLVERGMIESGVGADRRSRTLRLTEAGKLAHRRIERRRVRAASTLFAPLNEAERAQLVQLLARLTEAPLE